MSILEIHFHDLEFAPPGGGDDEAEGDERPAPGELTDGSESEAFSGAAALAVLATLAVFVALGALARRRLADSA